MTRTAPMSLSDMIEDMRIHKPKQRQRICEPYQMGRPKRVDENGDYGLSDQYLSESMIFIPPEEQS